MMMLERKFGLNPWAPVGTADEIDNLLRSMLDWLGGARPAECGFGGADLENGEKEVKITVPVPGCDASRTQVEITGDRVTVRAKSEPSGPAADVQRVLRRERRGFDLNESFTLPVSVDGARAKAECRDGVLYITVPRLPERSADVCRIEVR